MRTLPPSTLAVVERHCHRTRRREIPVNYDNARFKHYPFNWPDPSVMEEEVKTLKYDKDVHVRNLIEVGDVLGKNGVPFLLAFKTLLGAIRDAGPCEGEESVDLMIIEEDEPKLVELWMENQFLSDSLLSRNFKVCRVNEDVMTVVRYHALVNVYVMRKIPDSSPNTRYQHEEQTIDGWRVKNPWTMPLHSRTWRIPGHPEEYLEIKYGARWKNKTLPKTEIGL